VPISVPRTARECGRGELFAEELDGALHGIVRIRILELAIEEGEEKALSSLKP
jgi:hypothetical protein